MLRRLLAILALLTGLAAAGTPAHAGVAAMLGSQIEVSQRSEVPGRPAEAGCPDRGRQPQARGEKTAPCRQGRTVTVVIPTVQFGSDRAFE